jgi:hypothetical protein
VGPSGFADAVTAVLPEDWFRRAEVGSVLDSPHNILLQAAIAGGVLGLLVALVLLGRVFALGVGSLRTSNGGRHDLLLGALTASTAVGVGLLTHVTSPKTTVALSILIGVLIARSPQEAPKTAAPRRPWVRRMQVATLAVWTVVVGVWTVGDTEMLRGTQAAAAGDVTRAQSAFSRAHLLRPWDADIPLAAAEALGGAADRGAEGAGEQAEVWARQAVDRLPGSARAHEALGMIASGQGDLDRAADELSAATSLSPVDPRLHHELGLVLLEDGHLDDARDELQRAGALAPDSVVTWQALVQVCLLLSDSECVSDAQLASEEAGTD